VGKNATPSILHSHTYRSLLTHEQRNNYLLAQHGSELFAKVKNGRGFWGGGGVGGEIPPFRKGKGTL